MHGGRHRVRAFADKIGERVELRRSLPALRYAVDPVITFDEPLRRLGRVVWHLGMGVDYELGVMLVRLLG